MRFVESGTTKLSSKSPTCLAGEFATFDELNQNNRVYPRHVYEEALRPLIERAKSRSLMGECDHPIDYDEVRLSNVSHAITKLEVKGNKVFGEIELLDTPAGKILKALNEAGIPLGISSRAVGDSTIKEGHEEVTNMQLITYDVVADPSFKTAVLSEVSKAKLGESIKSIESSVRSLNECRSTRSMIKSIRETLLRDSSSNVDINVDSMEVDALKGILDKKVQEIKSLRSQNTALSESVKESANTLRSLRSDLSDRETRLTSLRSNMERLQSSFNEMKETTVLKSDYDKLMKETVELRKRLVVESRGLSYSQVRKMLEGATTEEEIKSRLDSIPKRRMSNNSVVEDLKESTERVSESFRESKSTVPTKLGTIISRI